MLLSRSKCIQQEGRNLPKQRHTSNVKKTHKKVRGKRVKVKWKITYRETMIDAPETLTPSLFNLHQFCILCSIRFFSPSQIVKLLLPISSRLTRIYVKRCLLDEYDLCKIFFFYNLRPKICLLTQTLFPHDLPNPFKRP